MSLPPPPAPSYRWAVATDPDRLVVQFTPVASRAGEGFDAVRRLFAVRGFRPVSPEVVLRPPAAHGCVLQPLGEDRAELIVEIGPRVGASRVPVPHGDPAWAGRVGEAQQVLVLLAEATLDADGELDEERLAADTAAGGVSCALVPVGALRDDG